MLRRLWDTRVARSFLGTWVIILLLAAGGLWLRASDLKRVEREIVVIRTERLCMQPVSCRRILGELLRLATPAQARHLKPSRGSRRVVRVLARRVADRNHTTVVRPHGRARPRGRRRATRKPGRVTARAPQPQATLPPSSVPPSGAPVLSPPPVTATINGPPGLCPEDSTARLHTPVHVIENVCVNVKP